MQSVSFRAMGSRAKVWLDSDVAVQDILWQVEAIEARLSRFRPESELCCLNLCARSWMPVSEVMHANISAAVRAAHVTDGLVTPLVLKALVIAGYDRDFADLQPIFLNTPIHLHDWREIQLAEGRVWLPDEIDLGGTAKGWTAQHIAEQLGTALVSLGGDIVARGKSWRINVADPFELSVPFTTITLEDQAVATSGTRYRRWATDRHHIIDPRTAQPAQTDVISATVIHPDAVLAEAFAKAVVIQGSRAGLAWLNKQPNAAGLVFCNDGSAVATNRFKSYIGA